MISILSHELKILTINYKIVQDKLLKANTNYLKLVESSQLWRREVEKAANGLMNSSKGCMRPMKR